MIVVKEENVVAIDPNYDINIVDGVYYGVICSVTENSVITDNKNQVVNIIYKCNVYIPNIYTKYDKDAVYNYPVVDIFFKQDSDDVGSEPQIGNLVKVMFENGDARSCKLIYTIPTSEDSRINNELFLTKGILSTRIVNETVNLEQNEIYRQLLDIAYYVTTGKTKDKLTKKDFKICVLGPNPKGNGNLSYAKNYFCNVLDLPFCSYFTSDIYGYSVPINSSSMYSISNVITNLYDNYYNNIKDDIKSYYNNSKYDFSYEEVGGFLFSPYYIYNDSISNSNLSNSELNSLMFKFVLSTIAYYNPQYLSILFPGEKDNINKLKVIINNSSLNEANQKCYPEYLWEVYNSSTFQNREFSYLYSNFLYKNIDIYEQAWLSFVPRLLSGLNNIVGDKENTKLKYIAVLCFTICPWLSYPALRYEDYNTINSRDKLASNNMLNFLSNAKDFRVYSTYISNDNSFKSIAQDLFNLLNKSNVTDYRSFVDSFQGIAKKVFGDGKLYVPSKINPEETWTYYNMDGKFNRLKNKLGDIEKII